MYSLNVYTALTNPVVRFVRVCDGMIWDNVAGALSLAPATYANTAITLTRNSYINGIPVTIPTALPAGEYDMLFYDSAAPANTDVVVIGKRIQWTGKDLLGLPQEL